MRSDRSGLKHCLEAKWRICPLSGTVRCASLGRLGTDRPGGCDAPLTEFSSRTRDERGTLARLRLAAGPVGPDQGRHCGVVPGRSCAGECGAGVGGRSGAGGQRPGRPGSRRAHGQSHVSRARLRAGRRPLVSRARAPALRGDPADGRRCSAHPGPRLDEPGIRLRLRLRPGQPVHDGQRLRDGRGAAVQVFRAWRQLHPAGQRGVRHEPGLRSVLPADHRRAYGRAPHQGPEPCGAAAGGRLCARLQPLPGQRRRGSGRSRPGLPRPGLGQADHSPGQLSAVLPAHAAARGGHCDRRHCAGGPAARAAERRRGPVGHCRSGRPAARGARAGRPVARRVRGDRQ